MSLHKAWRSRAARMAVAGGTAALAAVAGLPNVAHAAAPTITITTPSNGKLAADTAKQVLVLTVANQALSESTVTGVSLGPGCTNIGTYIVTSATTIAVKTGTAGCPATTASGGDSIDIITTSGTITKTGGLFFGAPPAIAAAADKPLVTENSALLDTNQVSRFLANGGQTARLRADAGYAFDPRSAAGLAITFSGKAATEVKVFDGTTNAQIPATTTSAPANGNYVTFKTATGMTAGDATLTVTQNGVSKNFSATDTGASVVSIPTVTSLQPASGKAKAATSTVITGVGFSKTEADWKGSAATMTVNFCGVPATVNTVASSGTSLTVTTPDVTDLPDGLGTGVFAGTCPVTITDTTAHVTGPITPGGYFTFVKE